MSNDALFLSRIADALDQLVTLDCYRQNISLLVVHDSPARNRVIDAIGEKIEQDQRDKLAQRDTNMDRIAAALTKAGVAPQEIQDRIAAAKASGEFEEFPLEVLAGTPAEREETFEDPLFYDRVRRTLGYLNVPFSDLDDLDALAEAHGWTREKMEEQMMGMGLEP